MWIHYKFRHAIGWGSRIPLTGNSITVADLERAIIAEKLSSLEKKKKGRRCLADIRLLAYNAETGEEYGDDNEIPAETSVIVHLLTRWSKAFLESKRASQVKAQLGSSQTGECKQDTVIGTKKPLRSVWHYLKTPPGYICHRCHEPGHYIQACPTNGDPTYDIKGSKYPSTESKATCDNDVVSWTVSVPSRRYPKELNCPFCREAMKEAVLMRCCFRSFCDKCIRDRIISRSTCACGAINISADDIVPNMTLRAAIKRMVSSTSNSSSEEDRSCCLQAKCPGADRDSGAAAPVRYSIKSSPMEGSKESVAVSSVTDHCCGTPAPLPHMTECAQAGGSSELPWSPETRTVCIIADRPALPWSPRTSVVEVRQKGSNNMGDGKRASRGEDIPPTNVKESYAFIFCVSTSLCPYRLHIFDTLRAVSTSLLFVFGSLPSRHLICAPHMWWYVQLHVCCCMYYCVQSWAYV